MTRARAGPPSHHHSPGTTLRAPDSPGERARWVPAPRRLGCDARFPFLRRVAPLIPPRLSRRPIWFLGAARRCMGTGCWSSRRDPAFRLRRGKPRGPCCRKFGQGSLAFRCGGVGDGRGELVLTRGMEMDRGAGWGRRAVGADGWCQGGIRSRLGSEPVVGCFWGYTDRPPPGRRSNDGITES